ncbi:hypothetical protein C8R47DRAFT_992590 [Mycena vitilis]|nr:hypothetical protein C8R47DRAFT_992590 [Mycena vitilis]
METPPRAELLDAFRTHYNRFQTSVADIIQNPADAVVIARLGDDLDEYAELVAQHSDLFDPTELATIQTSLVAMQNDIDPDFLRWAYSQRTTAGIHRFLGVSRSTVRFALIRHGIVSLQSNPFATDEDPPPPAPEDIPANPELVNDTEDDLLDPNLPIPVQLPSAVEDLAPPQVASYTGPLSNLSDDELDLLLLRLRSHFRRAGLGMLDGMLRRLGHRVPRERVRQSLLRIDPVRRIFERIRIRRRVYSVPGPNSLWHHDGQHDPSVHNVRIERLWVDITVQLGATWSERFTILELRHGLDI